MDVFGETPSFTCQWQKLCPSMFKEGRMSWDTPQLSFVHHCLVIFLISLKWFMPKWTYIFDIILLLAFHYFMSICASLMWRICGSVFFSLYSVLCTCHYVIARMGFSLVAFDYPTSTCEYWHKSPYLYILSNSIISCSVIGKRGPM